MELLHPVLKNIFFDSIIFDFGAVIIDIDYNKAKLSFEKLGVKKFDDLFSKAAQNNLFDNLEKGLISENEFRLEIKKYAGIQLQDEAIDAAWNSMLFSIPQARFTLLEQLSKQLPLYLLSNTNSIHERAFETQIDEQYGYKKFKSFFTKIYFSHHIHKRKPDLEIFQYVINENKLNPHTTLFIDDSPQHIEGAIKAGLQAFYLQYPNDIVNLFKLKNP